MVSYKKLSETAVLGLVYYTCIAKFDSGETREVTITKGQFELNAFYQDIMNQFDIPENKIKQLEGLVSNRFLEAL